MKIACIVKDVLFGALALVDLQPKYLWGQKRGVYHRFTAILGYI